jgi:hypothetical protein
MPNLAHLEELLLGHEHALETIQGNLVELETEPVFAMLQVTTFTGTTRERTNTALTGIAMVWKLLPAYQAAVKQARGLADDIGPFRQGKLDELEDCLTDAHVEIFDAPVSVFARRLDQPAQQQRCLTIADLQAEMTGLYAEAVTAVGELDRVWSDAVPKLTKAIEQAEVILARSNDLRVQTDSEVLLLATKHKELSGTVATDPVEAVRRVSEIEELLLRISRRLQPVQERKDSVEVRLQRGQGRLQQLRSELSKGTELFTRAATEIAGLAPASPIDANGLDHAPNGLAPWLHSLDNSFTSGDWVSSAAGLDRWEALCHEWETSATRVVLANQSLLDQRSEMLGLLSATRAKALHRGKIEQQEITDMANRADDELRRVPCDLQRARELIQSYLHAVRSGVSPQPQSQEVIQP